MKTLRFHSKNKYTWNFTTKNVVLRESTPIDSFTNEIITPSHDEKQATCVVDPIRILFNQERINNLGATAAKAWIDSLSVNKNNALSELRKKCSDEDLISIIKSRHIQSPAELLAWTNYITDRMDEFNAELKKVVEAKQAETQKSVDTSQTATIEPEV